MNQLLDAALYYASIGWNIFPLAPGQKTPITKHGVKDATTKESIIREWWKKWPSANMGLACGDTSGIYVVDIDVRNDINGKKSLLEFPPLPQTVRQDTPTGGFHALFKATVPPANRNSYRSGIDIRGNGYYVVLAPSVHPNGGRYQWTLNCEPWTIQPAEYPEFLRPATRVPWMKQENTAHFTNNTSRQKIAKDVDVLLRAGAYLATCDPAIQGQAGHGKLLYAASKLVHGFLLSDSQVFDLLLREYNPRCVPPWDMSSQKDHKDFCRKITEARKLTPQHEPGWLLNDNSYSNNSDSGIYCDISDFIANGVSEQKSVVNPEQEYQYLIHPPGLLGEICEWMNQTAIKEQPFLSLACTLAFLGALFGRKVRDELGSRTNLYCMGVAPSSAGKAHSMNQIRRLAAASGSTSLLGGDDIASDSAIEDRVYREPATLFMWDEIGHLLAHIKSGISQHHAQIVSLLMKLYSSSRNIYLGKEYAEQQRQRVIVQPCCCIYGTSTLERFTSGISPLELQDGWLSRCLVFQAPIDVPKERDRRESSVPQHLIDKISEWHKRVIQSIESPILSQFVTQYCQKQPPSQIVVHTECDAEQVFIDFDNEAIQYGKQQPLLACLWAKAEENARRIALIVACGINYEIPSIDSAVARYACRLSHVNLLISSSTLGLVLSILKQGCSRCMCL